MKRGWDRAWNGRDSLNKNQIRIEINLRVLAIVVLAVIVGAIWLIR